MAKSFNFALGGLLGLTLISAIILSSLNVSADEQVKVSNVDISVPASCEMSGTGTNSHTADINNGTYMENIGKTTLTVFCNDGGGYAIYAVGYTGEEIGGTNSTKLVGEDYNLTIDTGVYAQGTTTSSVWAMKLTKVTNTYTSYLPANLTIENGFDSYHVVPAAYTKVASFTSTTDLTLGSKLETTYAAYISGTQRADIYNGKVKYTLVHPNTSGDDTIYSMQDVNTWKSTLTTGQKVSAIDTRDSKVYRVAKLADGNVWMVQNLDLDLDSTKTYTNEDTDLGWNASTSTYGTASWTPSSSTKTNYVNWSGDSIQESYDPGEIYWSGVPGDSTQMTTGIPEYSIGNFYTFGAAIAVNDVTGIPSDSDTTQSICPRGWSLPSANQLNSMLTTYGFSSTPVNGNNALWKAPIYLGLFGMMDRAGASFISFGTYSNYWMPHIYDTFYAIRFSFGSEVYSGSLVPIVGGINIRCVAR